MKDKKLIYWLCLSGVISVVFYFLHDMIGALYYPGYNRLSQAVSDLTATDAPSFIVASGYVTVYKIFSCLCCTMLCILVQNEEKKTLRIGIYVFTIMNFVSAIGYTMFPLSGSGYDGSLQSMIHAFVVTTLVVLLSISSLVLIAIGAFKSKYRYLGCLSVLALVLMFIGAVGSGIVPKEYFGFVERFSTYSAVVFTGILSLFGFTYVRD